MPSLVINNLDSPTEIVYLDSGRPNTQTEVYTTVVIVHGHSFHSGIFQRALPLAPSKGIRLICVNRRDYAPTTLLSASELDTMAHGDETERAAFLQERGIEMAMFLDRLIDNLSLPPPTPDDAAGGLALMGWSLGNIVPIAIVAGVSSLPAGVQKRLQSYVRRLILHNPPSVALGFKGPPKYYHPMHDESIPKEDRGAAFTHWASGYFDHGDLAARNLDTIAYKDPDPSRKSSVARMSPQEFSSVVDFAPGPRSEVFFNIRFETAFFQQTCKALLDPVTRALWPHLCIWMLYGDSAAWFIIHAAWEIEKMAEASGEQAVKFSEIKGANTFVFWDEPEKALDACLHCLNN